MTTPLVTLNPTGVCSTVIGEAHGLPTAATVQAYTPQVAAAVETLVANAEKPGAWCRWLTLGTQPQLLADISTYTQGVAGQFDDVVVLGIGGSALGAKALFAALCHPLWNVVDATRKGAPRLHVVDNVDTDYVHGLLDTLTLKRTLVVAISKSGSTIEPMSALLLVMQAWEQAGITQAEWAKYLVMVTDPEKGLFRPFAEEHNIPCFDVPDDVGGRFSVFSAVGLLPLALLGVDVKGLLDGIQTVYPAVTDTRLAANPAGQLAAMLVAYYRQGKPNTVIMPYARGLEFVADWFVQLWAESLGKATDVDGNTVNLGPTPIKAVGATDQHSQLQLFAQGTTDKVVLFIEVANAAETLTITDVPAAFSAMGYLKGHCLHHILNAELNGTQQSLTEAGRPTLRLTLPEISPQSIGALLFMLEVTTALAGYLLNIDPFDQPGVEASKIITKAILRGEQAAAEPAAPVGACGV